MESDVRYYLRRMQSERAAAHRALTSAARERRLALVQIYEAKLAALGGCVLSLARQFAHRIV